MRTLALAAFALATTLLPTPAHADEVQRCVEASERGQSARRRRALIEARSAFIECSAETCPAVVRTTCTEWLEQVEGALPTIVIATVTTDEQDLPSASVTLDGQAAPQGSAVPVDPGAHAIFARADGYEDTKVDFIAREGERSRTVWVKLPKAALPPPRREVQPITWITGGLAVAALGSFAFFGATGLSKADDLRSTCAPTCPDSERSSAATRYLVADISLIAAVVFGGVSVWTYLNRPTVPAPR